LIFALTLSIRALTIALRGASGIVLTPAAGQPASDTYCLVMLLPRDKANAYAAGHPS